MIYIFFTNRKLLNRARVVHESANYRKKVFRRRRVASEIVASTPSPLTKPRYILNLDVVVTRDWTIFGTMRLTRVIIKPFLSLKSSAIKLFRSRKFLYVIFAPAFLYLLLISLILVFYKITTSGIYKYLVIFLHKMYQMWNILN